MDFVADGLLNGRRTRGVNYIHRIIQRKLRGGGRDECLNTHRLLSLDDAKEKVETWRRDYNEFNAG